MANTKISALTATTSPTWSEEFVYAYNSANGKITLDTMKTFASADSQATLVSGVNIKTINWTSILGSGNIDVSWGGWGFTPTELGWDANIWELSEWAYITTYDLYYISWSKVPAVSSSYTKKQMLFVTEDSSSWTKWFFVFNAWRTSSSYIDRAAFGYSVSSSEWNCRRLWAWDASLERYGYTIGSWLSHPEAITSYTLTQIIDDIDDSWTNELAVTNNTDNAPYPWMTYTIYVNSVKEWETYTITLGDWVTNPLNITLPSSSDKKCVITVLVTSTTTGIVSSCVMES